MDGENPAKPYMPPNPFGVKQEYWERIQNMRLLDDTFMSAAFDNNIEATQRDFVLGLIEQALDEAEREAARTEETATGQPDEADARYEPDAEAPDGEPEVGEDADSGDGARPAEWN